ncbi:hypothetical protein [Pseudomonas paralcaligenes]|uniref:hypothetical protein n=1 Tax=Pseudomonas paralcaligenes TaxID=2772558 RepID=UPI001C7E4DFD|nr:hypothetical protein [Pseudomonas paralcaligenes]
MRSYTPLFSIGLFSLLFLVILAAIIQQNPAGFSYTLDDPYIHLALAERIANGHYGINLGENTSPSSSILWPFILVVGTGHAWHQYLPLAINFVCGTLAALLIARIADSLQWRPDDRFVPLKKMFLIFLLLFIGNIPGVAFSGMEHNLQILIAVVGAYALLLFSKGRPIPLWCLACIAIGPSVRYELLAIVAVIAALFCFQKRPWHGLLFLSGSLVIPVTYGIYLNHLGLSPLPNSVLAKSDIHEFSTSELAQLSDVIRFSTIKALFWSHAQQAYILLMFGLLLCLIKEKRTELRLITLLTLGAMLAHLAIGRFGWLNRYEVYMFLFGALMFCITVSGFARNNLASVLSATAVLMLCSYPYLRDTTGIPFASEDIYSQQFQMHRFVQEYYQGNFAVNDLGWVSYKLPQDRYVLDIYGLASNDALKTEKKDAKWLDEITHKHSANLIMYYSDWFDGIPSSWTKLATLKLADGNTIIAGDEVSFYASGSADENTIELLHRQLKEFSKTLPEAAILELQDIH